MLDDPGVWAGVRPLACEPRREGVVTGTRAAEVLSSAAERGTMSVLAAGPPSATTPQGPGGQV